MFTCPLCMGRVNATDEQCPHCLDYLNPPAILTPKEAQDFELFLRAEPGSLLFAAGIAVVYDLDATVSA